MMNVINVEITARCSDHQRIRQELSVRNADFAGKDHHVVTYFIDNIKIHLDRVKGLGTFLEIEAQSEAGGLAEDTLERQCRQLMGELGVRDEDLLADSYTDLLMI